MSGQIVNIPALLISKKEGNKLINYIKKTTYMPYVTLNFNTVAN